MQALRQLVIFAWIAICFEQSINCHGGHDDVMLLHVYYEDNNLYSLLPPKVLVRINHDCITVGTQESIIYKFSTFDIV